MECEAAPERLVFIKKKTGRNGVVRGGSKLSKFFRRDSVNKNTRRIPAIRSSAAECLTFVAAAGGVESGAEMRYEDENIWLTQNMMARIYDVSVSAIKQYLKRAFSSDELEEFSTFKFYPTTALDGKTHNARHYNLQATIAVGFQVKNERAVQFRKWASMIIKDYTIQGWTMDEERLKKGGTAVNDVFFERQLEKIREIRLSERRFYQKITDIYATSIDYDPSAKATKRFFSAIQNKMHYAVHGQTASEMIVDRANHTKNHMGLTHWDGSPEGKIHKYDVSVAKNYLSESELDQMQRIVSSYLDMAEVQAKRKIPMTMADWETRLGGFLMLWDREVLQDAGKVSKELAKAHAESEFEKFRILQDRLYESDFDKTLNMLRTLGREGEMDTSGG